VGDPDLKPDEYTAPRISPAELKKWLDEKRPITLLDTRNQYEVEVGTFSGAEPIEINTSREFAAKAATKLNDWKDRPVVTFCTGGIRCEKGSALLLKLGLKNVYQLDGGILRYFEENGSAHFDGNCFVFDMRMAVDGELKPVARADDPDKSFGRHILQPKSDSP
jgi:predicted sulfurtransferase